jgi:hypothetical protein
MMIRESLIPSTEEALELLVVPQWAISGRKSELYQ